MCDVECVMLGGRQAKFVPIIFAEGSTELWAAAFENGGIFAHDAADPHRFETRKYFAGQLGLGIPPAP